MKYWIVPSNNKRYRLIDFLKENEFVDWKQGRYNFQNINELKQIINNCNKAN